MSQLVKYKDVLAFLEKEKDTDEIIEYFCNLYNSVDCDIEEVYAIITNLEQDINERKNKITILQLNNKQDEDKIEKIKEGILGIIDNHGYDGKLQSDANLSYIKCFSKAVKTLKMTEYPKWAVVEKTILSVDKIKLRKAVEGTEDEEKYLETRSFLKRG